MIDLHVHFDGSVQPQTVLELAREQGESLPAKDLQELTDYFRLKNYVSDYQAYLDRFKVVNSVLQDKRSIRRVARELVLELNRQGVDYAEIRFCPQMYTLKGMKQRQAIEAALLGMKQGMDECSGIQTNLMLCTVRGADEKDNFETIVEAKRYLRKGVAGIDLIGDEPEYGADMYEAQLQLIAQEEIPLAVHAGEQTGPEHIRKAIECGARRIGHALSAAQDEELLALIKEKNILLEMCVSSNLITGRVRDIKEHPIRLYYDKGLRVCINSDNLVISNTDIRSEYNLLKENLGFTAEEIITMNRYAAEGAFIPSMAKERLLDKLKDETC